MRLHEHATVDSVAAAVAAGGDASRRSRPTSASTPTAPPAAIELLEACLAGARRPEELIAIAGEFRAARARRRRLSDRPQMALRAGQEPAPRLLAVNADEGEPGTFKDRYFLETDPHRFLEGMLIAAWAMAAADTYLYLRDEYPQCREILEREIAAVEAAGLAHAHHDPPPARRRRLYLRRGIGDARKHRRQARTAAAQAAVSGAGRASSAGRP